MLHLIIGLYHRYKELYNSFMITLGLKMGKYKRFPIEQIENVAEDVALFKEETEEDFYIHKIYGFINKGSFVTTMPKLPLWLMKRAIVYFNSDFVRVGDKVIWSKKDNFNFCKLIPTDKMMVSYEDNALIVKRPSFIHKVEYGFSLIGTHCDIWSHSLSDYFPKLSMLEKALEIAGTNVTVLVPDYKDGQLKQVIYDSIQKHQNAKLLVVKENEAVEVKSLFYMDRPCRFTDHELYVEIGDSIQPKIISDILKKDLVEYYKKRYNIGICEQSRKLFLARKPGMRNISNYSEVEDYFKKNGFEVIEPHKFSLEEKIKVFNSASHIVGPYSSGFSNTIFCQPQTKCLIFTNYNRAFECWLTMQEQYFEIDILTVTGTDSKKGSRAHCGYTIPLSKIKAAAKQLGIINE